MDGGPLLLWERMLLFLELFLENKHLLATILHMQAIKLLKLQINVGWHSADLTAWTMVSSIVLRCHVWLVLRPCLWKPG